jgi:hypothetical protein
MGFYGKDMMRTAVARNATVAIASALAVFGCGARPRMCSSGECAIREACVAGRCIVSSATPAVARALRFAFEAQKRTVSPFREARDGLLELRSNDELFFAFDLAALPGRPVVEAYVVVSLPEVDVGSGEGVFSAQPIVEPWSVESARWRPPHRARSSSALSFLVAPTSQLMRVDVRREIETAQRDPGAIEGLAIRYAGAARASVCWDETPSVSCRAPQLEVYVESPKPPQRPTVSSARAVVVRN